MDFRYDLSPSTTAQVVQSTNEVLPIHPLDLELKRAQIDNLNNQSEHIKSASLINSADARAKVLTPYIQAMVEIRTALNFPMVADNQAMTEKVVLEKMWDETDIGRLRTRYFAVMDKFMEIAEIKKPS